MSSSHYQVYAAATERLPVARVATEVASLTGVDMVRMSWPEQDAYRGDSESFAVVVTDHDLEDLDGLPFTEYPYEIEVWDFSGDRPAELAVVRRIEAALARSGYRTLITWDAQTRIDPT